jgi:hypothetical protein
MPMPGIVVHEATAVMSNGRVLLLAAMFLAGIGIIIYATLAAMGK